MKYMEWCFFYKLIVFHLQRNMSLLRRTSILTTLKDMATEFYSKPVFRRQYQLI